MRSIVELFRSLQVVIVVMIIGITVWVSGWERDLRNQLKDGMILPAVTREEMRDLRANQDFSADESPQLAQPQFGVIEGASYDTP